MSWRDAEADRISKMWWLIKYDSRGQGMWKQGHVCGEANVFTKHIHLAALVLTAAQGDGLGSY